MVSPEVT